MSRQLIDSGLIEAGAKTYADGERVHHAKQSRIDLLLLNLAIQE